MLCWIVFAACLIHFLLPCCMQRQVRLTGGLNNMLPGFLPSFLFGAPVPIDKLVLDDERHTMYSLASNSALQVSMRGWCRLVAASISACFEVTSCRMHDAHC